MDWIGLDWILLRRLVLLEHLTVLTRKFSFISQRELGKNRKKVTAF